jgi:hypothetical protein
MNTEWLFKALFGESTPLISGELNLARLLVQSIQANEVHVLVIKLEQQQQLNTFGYCACFSFAESGRKGEGINE